MLTVSLGSDRELFRFPAVISAGRYAEMSFEVGGLVDDVSVVESQEVGKGDTLVRLNQRGFQNRLAAALAQFESAVAEYDRAVRIAKEDAIAPSVVEQRATQRDVAKTELDNAEKAVEDSVLRAPFAGTVAKLTVKRDQNVAIGQVVVTLIDLDTMEEIFQDIQADIRFDHELNGCLNCGICTATCPAAHYYDFSPREIVQLLWTENLEGIYDAMQEKIWACAQCMTCAARCPFKNSPGGLVAIMREVAIKHAASALSARYMTSSPMNFTTRPPWRSV